MRLIREQTVRCFQRYRIFMCTKCVIEIEFNSNTETPITNNSTLNNNTISNYIYSQKICLT